MCVLHLKIDTDNINLFIQRTKLPIYQFYKKGDKHKYRKAKVFDSTLISCDVSQKKWGDIEGQTDDMIKFLKKYDAELTSINDNYKQVDWYFDLPYNCLLDNETYNQNNFLPAELLLLSGQLGIGINLSLYPTGTDD